MSSNPAVKPGDVLLPFEFAIVLLFCVVAFYHLPDTGHKALCPVSLTRLRPGILRRNGRVLAEIRDPESRSENRNRRLDLKSETGYPPLLLCTTFVGWDTSIIEKGEVEGGKSKEEGLRVRCEFVCGPNGTPRTRDHEARRPRVNRPLRSVFQVRPRYSHVEDSPPRWLVGKVYGS